MSYVVLLAPRGGLKRAKALFASLIIRLFQLVFSVGIVFFSHNKSDGTVFRLIFSAKRTGPKSASTLFLSTLFFTF